MAIFGDIKNNLFFCKLKNFGTILVVVVETN